jgi:transposase InsO family protein
MVVVDRLTKMAHFIPCHKTITSEQTAELLLQHIFRLHGIPDETVSNQGPQFVAKYYKRLMELLGIGVKLSSAFCPQTDGQTKRVNQVLEQYLHCTSCYQQDNWAQLLPQAEFSYNNTLHISTGVSPFYANYGYHPQLDFQATTEVVVPSAEDRAAQLNRLHQDLQRELTRAQERYKEQADVHRKEAPVFHPGDKVWLLQKNIQTT